MTRLKPARPAMPCLSLLLLPLLLLLSFPASGLADEVQDVLNRRCVVCHGCYDAPCQLKLSSANGWERGASRQKVYDSSRLEDAPMTRLGIDAATVTGWRGKGFFDVTGTEGGLSVLEQLLRAGRAQTFQLGAPLPDDIDISPLRANTCAARPEVATYLKEHPLGGMPFAMAPLSDEDYETLANWARAGAPRPDSDPALPANVKRQIGDIEAFLNGEDIRQRLIARYIFEHLFLAHLHLEGDDPRRFFRLIRARTDDETDALSEEIPTRRPFDDPGGPFRYRLVPLDGTVLHKEHMVYAIGPKRLARYRELFLGTDWSLEQLPPYSAEAGGNPLSTFAALPARARYRFLLDDALYFVRSFIRGPVCYGQVAVNVIEDRFWVSFLDPDADLSVTDPAYLRQAVPILELPVAQSDGKLSERLQSFLQRGPVRYQAYRQDRYAQAYERSGGPDYGDIWDGDGTNRGARLTVYRNFTSASVVTGFVGDIPETAWVIDFPLFERIYYNLVAGFDVFGNVEHQLTTRLYMDGLRREGERIFLSFLPPQIRKSLHDSWYRGPLVNLLDLWKESALDRSSATGIAFASSFPKREFLTGLIETGSDAGLWPPDDPINRCQEACAAPDSVPGQLRPLTRHPAAFAKFLPDISVLLVATGTGDEIYTLVHDMAHSNVAFVFNEDLRREPDLDRLTVVPGQFSSYPNFYFRVPEGKLAEFVAMTRKVRTQNGYLRLVKSFGVRRTDPQFWSVHDRVQAALDAQDPLEAGLLDLNRYRDPKALDPIERLLEFTFELE